MQSLPHPYRSFALIRALSVFCFGLMVICAGPVSLRAGEEASKREYDLPSGDAGEALKMFSQQSGRGVIANGDLVKGVRTNPVKGAFTPGDALDLMLADTGLVATQDRKSGAFAVRKESEAEAKNVSRAIAESSKSGRPERKSELVENEQGEKVIKLDTFEVFGRKTLNMDIRRTQDDIQPYVVFSRDQIEMSGARDITVFLNSQLTAAPNPSLNAQQSGLTQGDKSGIELRGLGGSQTLVLIDGRRAASLSASGVLLQPDLNTIPLAAIERIEVLPTTASGIYGGGATGGVVNVILRRDYQGVSLGAEYFSPVAHGGGQGHQINLSAGVGSQSTSFTIFASVSQRSELAQGDRDFFSDLRAAQVANNPASIYSNATPPLGQTTNIRSRTGVNLVTNAAFGSIPLGSPITYVPVGYAGASASGVSGLVGNAGKYDLSLANTAQLSGGARSSLVGASDLWSVRTMLRREINTQISVFLEGFASRAVSRKSNNVMTSTFDIPASAPNNPFAQDIRVTTPTLGADQTNETVLKDRKITAGITVGLPHDWHGESDITWERTTLQNQLPRTGIAAAAAAAISSANLDLLKDTNLFRPDFGTYLLPVQRIGPVETVLKHAAIRVGGPALSLPGGPIALSGLAEWRKESAGESLNSNGSGGGSVFGPRSQEVTSYYAEAGLPLWKAADGRHLFSLQAAGRYDDYKSVGANQVTLVNGAPSGVVRFATNRFNSIKPTVGIKYAPISDIAFRASYARGFIPPSISDLVQKQPVLVIPGIALGGLTDPRRGNEVVGDFELWEGGSPNLRPETSESYGAGVILTPRVIPRLRISLDWARIVKRDNLAIAATFSQSDFVNESAVPGVIVRNTDPSTFGTFGVGPMVALNARTMNISFARIEAVDAMIEYEIPTKGIGSFALSARLTKQLENLSQFTAVSPVIDRIGTQGGPQWTANAQLLWKRGPWRVAWFTRYLGQTYFTRFRTTNANTGTNSFGGQFLHDFSVAVMLPGLLRNAGQVEGQLGVDNVLNEEGDLATISRDGRIDPSLARAWAKVRVNF